MKYRKIIIALTVVLLLLITAAGSLFLFGPQIDRIRRIYVQHELMNRILDGETEIVLQHVPVVDGVEMEFYAEEEAEPVKERRPSIEVTGYGIIEIPSIELAMPLVKGVSAQSLNAAAGWYEESAEVGSAGNTVILGHRMYGYGEHFNRLDEVKPGDEIIITLADRSYYVYTVSGNEIITPGNLVDTLAAHNEGFSLTLVTCTPTGVGSHRLLVYAELTETKD